MIKRYTDPRIAGIWKPEAKFALWQKVELAVVEARSLLGRISPDIHSTMKKILEKNPIDINFIDEKERVLLHDLNSFLEERMQFLPPELQAEFHKKMTSYDTEEAPFATMLEQSVTHVEGLTVALLNELKVIAIKYRYTPMNARTHGQEAEMQSFGKRCLTWHEDLMIAYASLGRTKENLEYSKLSGAIGTNSGIDPELEKCALNILGFKPHVGATQIMPRILYAPIASALADMVLVINKIATDIRLGARSGCPLWQEPFGKNQKGSSAMPHKKNTILTENIEGMSHMAQNYANGLRGNIGTWEERAIAQSSVERVFWPDLFHVTVRAITTMTKVISGLVVYPDNMLKEIILSRGCYASNEAKELLVELGLPYGLAREDAYRIIQLASFNVFAPYIEAKKMRSTTLESLKAADYCLDGAEDGILDDPSQVESIQEIVVLGDLSVSPELSASADDVERWNGILQRIFSSDHTEELERWNEIFKPSHILANESYLFEKAFE